MNLCTLIRSFIITIAVVFSGCNNNTGSSKHAALARPEPAADTICLLPYTGFDTTLLAAAAKEANAFYKCPVTILSGTDLPRKAWYAPRSRYRADSLLSWQATTYTGKKIIAGLTCMDISTTSGRQTDWGVFGLGYCPGRSCIVSTWRLGRNPQNRRQLQERLAKVLLHELGHNFGLPHCTHSEPQCLMNDARGTMTQVDRERLWLCTGCRSRLS